MLDRLAVTIVFRVSRPLGILDYFRTPYEVDDELERNDLVQLRACVDGGELNGPAMLWPRAGQGNAVAATLLADGAGTGIVIFGRVAADPLVESLLEEHGGSWLRSNAVIGTDGVRLGSLWRAADGSVFLPFDPDEVVDNFRTERYASIARGGGGRALRRGLMVVYYRLRPLLPRRLQIWLRRRFVRIQARARFPRWPAETSLHDLLDLMFALLAEIAGEPVPRIAVWPNGHRWALVLTHDVERAAGYAAIDPVLELERAHGVRSSWNFVPRRDYQVATERTLGLVADGFEVGVHGFLHDGRDLESLATLQERLPGIREAAERWGAVGFRAPAMHRDWQLVPLLRFDYDLSYPDTDPFEPVAGGCCSWLPFFIGDTVELPLTLPQDHTLFVILRHRDERAWLEKTELLRARGAMALIDTHPDYLLDEQILRAYDRFLARFAGDRSAWKVLPRELSAWWRRRAASSLERDGETWRVVGPAAGEGAVELCDASSGLQR